jgi:hypothetical protein
MKRHCENEQQPVVDYTLHLEYDADRCSKMLEDILLSKSALN